LRYEDFYYTPNFKYSEFTDIEDTINIMSMDPEFILLLQKLRDFIGSPINVTHGLRPWWYQFYEICGGDWRKYYDSEHQFGRAADITTNKTIEGMINLASSAKIIGFKRIGFYPYSISKFIHVDMGKPRPSESWIRNEKGKYFYYNTITEAIEIIKKGDKNVQ
jgi:uncharacterized protein YcbK (DUF882 family)